MTYDETAKKLAVKVIGTVESNLDYGAVNYGDPITVGIAQWYGVRAAALLDRMRDENPGSWYGVEASIANQLDTIPASDTWWNGRRLTYTEGNSLVGAMERNQVLQNEQLVTDLDAYKTVAVNHGVNPDANTATMIYFFAMYHQGPAYAVDVLDAAGPTATLDQIHAECLANPVLGQYGSRYRTAYDLISVADLSGVDPAPVTPPPVVVPNGNAKTIQQAGDLLMVRFENGERVPFYPSGRGQWVPHKAATAPPPPDPVQPPPPAGTGNWGVPLAGSITISSPYGPRPTPPGSADLNGGFHYGADLVPTGGGAPDVIAPADMVVTFVYDGSGSDPSSGTGGRYVKGHATDGSYTFCFFHMQAGSIVVAVGDTVAVGQKIGVMGGTGNVTGPHLHFETYEGNLTNPWPPPYGNPVDPIAVLRAHGVNI